MSYEEKIKIYKNMIRNLEIELKHYEGTPYFEDEEFKIRERINMHKEELRLYAQAAKADKYEAKAEAFDAICKAHVPLEKRMSPVTIDEGLDFAEETEGIILKFYESGERNES